MDTQDMDRQDLDHQDMDHQDMDHQDQHHLDNKDMQRRSKEHTDKAEAYLGTNGPATPGPPQGYVALQQQAAAAVAAPAAPAMPAPTPQEVPNQAAEGGDAAMVDRAQGHAVKGSNLQSAYVEDDGEESVYHYNSSAEEAAEDHDDSEDDYEIVVQPHDSSVDGHSAEIPHKARNTAVGGHDTEIIHQLEGNDGEGNDGDTIEVATSPGHRRSTRSRVSAGRVTRKPGVSRGGKLVGKRAGGRGSDKKRSKDEDRATAFGIV
ncbi:Uu.00g142090.m01.CDS01 [Anthostomella pinea]|uniref:Uu.00g142090.m01.CDS01 n=1 Tax=Anthostomella pinea TaxID=933095 RepID=A0AAI8YLE7_9PEZI|nr:Uu.00g142090.m01.CDS01 [Anthostomella pinea]